MATHYITVGIKWIENISQFMNDHMFIEIWSLVVGNFFLFPLPFPYLIFAVFLIISIVSVTNKSLGNLRKENCDIYIILYHLFDILSHLSLITSSIISCTIFQIVIWNQKMFKYDIVDFIIKLKILLIRGTNSSC